MHNPTRCTRAVTIGYPCGGGGHEVFTQSNRLTLDQGDTTAPLLEALRIRNNNAAAAAADAGSGSGDGGGLLALLNRGEHTVAPWTALVRQRGYEDLVDELIAKEPMLGRPALLASLTRGSAATAARLNGKGLRLEDKDLEPLLAVWEDGRGSDWYDFAKADGAQDLVHSLVTHVPRLKKTIPDLILRCLLPGESPVAAPLLRLHCQGKPLDDALVDTLLEKGPYTFGPGEASHLISGYPPDAWFTVDGSLTLGSQRIGFEYELCFEMHVRAHRFCGGCMLACVSTDDPSKMEGRQPALLKASVFEVLITFESHSRGNHPTGRADFNSKMIIDDACGATLSVGVDEGSTQKYKLVRSQDSLTLHVDNRSEPIVVPLKEPERKSWYPRNVELAATPSSELENILASRGVNVQLQPCDVQLRGVTYASRQTSGWERLVMHEPTAPTVDLLLDTTPRLASVLTTELKHYLMADRFYAKVLHRLVQKSHVSISVDELLVPAPSGADGATVWEELLTSESTTALVDLMLLREPRLLEITTAPSMLAKFCVPGSGAAAQRLVNRGARMGDDLVKSLLVNADEPITWSSMDFVVIRAHYVATHDASNFFDGTSIVQAQIRQAIVEGQASYVMDGAWEHRNALFDGDPTPGSPAKDVVVELSVGGKHYEYVSPEGEALVIPLNVRRVSSGCPPFVQMALVPGDATFVDGCLALPAFAPIAPKMAKFALHIHDFALAARLLQSTAAVVDDELVASLIADGTLDKVLSKKEDALLLALVRKTTAASGGTPGLKAAARDWLLSGGSESKWTQMVLGDASPTLIEDLCALDGDGRLATAADSADIFLAMLGRKQYTRAADRLKDDVDVHIVAALLSKPSDEAMMALPYEMALFLPQALVLESPHKYPNNADHSEEVKIEGAGSLMVAFDGRSVTEKQYDYLWLQKSNTSEERWGERIYDGTNFPGMGGKPALKVDAESFTLRFKSDESSNEWGYRAVVWPTACAPGWCVWAELLLSTDAQAQRLVAALSRGSDQLADFATGGLMQGFKASQEAKLKAAPPDWGGV